MNDQVTSMVLGRNNVRALRGKYSFVPTSSEEFALRKQNLLEARLLSRIIVQVTRRKRMGIIKYIPLILRFKNVSEVYKEETGDGKPFYLSRRFIGLLITIIFAIVTIKTGITIDEALSAQIAEHVVSLITALIALYGIVLTVIGHFKRTK